MIYIFWHLHFWTHLKRNNILNKFITELGSEIIQTIDVDKWILLFDQKSDHCTPKILFNAKKDIFSILYVK